MNLLALHGSIKLYSFKVYNSIIHYLYIVLRVHHPKSSLLPSPFICHLPSYTCPHPPLPLVITILLSVSINFFLLNSFTYFTQSSNPLPSDSCQSVLCVSESVPILLVYFALYIPHASKIIWYLSLSGLFHLA